MTYQLIYADPPWHFKVRSSKGEGRSAEKHYKIMSLKELHSLQVYDIASKNSVCLMWIIDPMVEDGYKLMRSWGFVPKTVGFYWVKLNKKWDVKYYKILNGLKKSIIDANKGINPTMLEKIFFTGLGYYTRANPEQCIIGVKGKGLPRIDKGVPRLIIAPRGKHSQKPTEAYGRIERLFGDVSRLEMFARNTRIGWDSFGNEIENSVIIPLADEVN
jgi:N6-adenosine-specific RNA methylase IME4